MKGIICNSEVLPFGGIGRFVQGKAETALTKMTGDASVKGSVALFYLDPPFCTGDMFCTDDALAYADNMSETAYMRMMKSVLTSARELLSTDGSIYVHIDYRMSAKIRLLLDRVFGENNFVNEIIWSYKSGGRAKNFFSRKHDTIYLYRKTRKYYFNIAPLGTPRGTDKRNNMKRGQDKDGRVFFSINSGGKTYKYYETDPVYPTDVWTDIEHLQQKDRERIGYPTQKPKALLRRIMLASSYEGATVCDPFSGSGTTAEVASDLNRRWLAVDSSLHAAAALRKRLIASYMQGALLQTGESVFEYARCAHHPAVRARLSVKGHSYVVKLETDGVVEQFSVGVIDNATFFPRYNSVTKGRTQLEFPCDCSKLFAHVFFANGERAVVICD